MRLRCAFFVGIVAGGLAWGELARADYDWPMTPWGAYHQRHPNSQLGSPNCPLARSSQARPGASGQYPWYGAVWGVPTYNWGYFGAPSNPTTTWHRGYYHDLYQWGQWRRY